MKIDVLVAEIGSTTTVINGFQDVTGPCPRFLGQGQAPTTVTEGDVNIGLQKGIENLKKQLNINDLEYNEMLATSSAAGGLKMTVHGLVYDMTVRAAQEAALGAGANIHQVTAGKLRRTDLKKIEESNPNIILIAGGVDYGERDTALYNAEQIAKMNLNIPVIYAGNIENHGEIKEIFNGKNCKLYITENVYPKIDQLNIEPTRKIIQDVFEEHITGGPGMGKIRDMINGPIIPTPGAVMEASKLLKESIGDLITFDVGGATTDVHSVTLGSEEISRILISPEPEAKRTVEGDLGVYVNMANIVEKVGIDKLKKELQLDIDRIIESYQPIPRTKEEIMFVERLALEALLIALERHVGKLRHIYGPGGKTTIAEGKDLSNIINIVGTGGALTRLPHSVELLRKAISKTSHQVMLPKKEVNILIDRYYIMSSLGVLSKRYPGAAIYLMKESMGLK